MLGQVVLKDTFADLNAGIKTEILIRDLSKASSVHYDYMNTVGICH